MSFVKFGDHQALLKQNTTIEMNPIVKGGCGETKRARAAVNNVNMEQEYVPKVDVAQHQQLTMWKD